MIRSLWIAKTGMDAQQTQLDVISNNLANVGTNGSADGARFRLDVQELEDENTGVNAQPIQVRLLNLKLLLDTEDRAG